MNNHLPISKEMEAVMQKHLSEKYSEEEADERWKKIIFQYESFLKDLPDFGGKKSRKDYPAFLHPEISRYLLHSERRNLRNLQSYRS